MHKYCEVEKYLGAISEFCGYRTNQPIRKEKKQFLAKERKGRVMKLKSTRILYIYIYIYILYKFFRLSNKM